MRSFLGRIQVWVLAVFILAFFIPIYLIFPAQDVADVLSGAAIVGALAMFWNLGKGVDRFMTQPLNRVSMSASIWLLGMQIIAGQNAFNRGFNLWWRTFGNANPSLYLTFIPAFAGYLAFIGYMLQNTIVDDILSWKRIVIILVLGLSLGGSFVVLHHYPESFDASKLYLGPYTHPSR